jgi:hypothetical protein
MRRNMLSTVVSIHLHCQIKRCHGRELECSAVNASLARRTGARIEVERFRFDGQVPIEDVHAAAHNFSVKTEMVNDFERPLAYLSTPFSVWETVGLTHGNSTCNVRNTVGLFHNQNSHELINSQLDINLGWKGNRIPRGFIRHRRNHIHIHNPKMRRA